MTVFCQKDGCCKTWPRHPALNVACPDCDAQEGNYCKRPSGHKADFHRVRMIEAERRGHFGACPDNVCFEDPEKLAHAQSEYDRLHAKTDQLSMNV